MKELARNKKAYFAYHILEKFEAGIALIGQEVKSVKSGRISFKGAYVTIRDEEAFLRNAFIPPYQPNNAPRDYDPERSRKLLLRKEEIKYLLGKRQEKGLTIIPLRVYNKRGKIKLEIALAKGKREFDKREKIKKRETDRKIRRAIKDFNQ